MVARILNAIFTFFQNLFAPVLSFIASLAGHVINAIITVLKAIFKPVLILIAIIFYFVYKVAELFVTLLAVLLAIGKLLYSFVMGLFKTLAGLVWTQTTPPAHGSWSAPIGEVFAALEPYQLDKIAYVLLFVIWVLTAVGAIRILSSRGEA